MHFTRRSFLVDGLRLSALVPLLSLGRRPSTTGERVLVVVQLTGGNDGLNTVVPRRQDGYFRLRPTLALKPEALHALDDECGLHPSLGELGRLFAEGRMSVVHGVGYPEANRSHFRSMEIWHSAEPRAPANGVGWLGRLADQLSAREPGAMPALFVGEGAPPLALRGRDTLAPSLEREEDLRLAELPGLERQRTRLVEESGGGARANELLFLRTAARSAYAASARLEAAVARPGQDGSPGGYPDLELARKLRLIAKLVAGGFDTRLFLVTLDGFDTHARQAPVHAARLDELGRSLGAFQRDLEATGSSARVLTLVFSEFGRRCEENASRGTDHGAAAPVFLVGGERSVALAGTPPDLEHLSAGDIGYTTDFRALYTTLEHDWMGLEPSSTIPGLALL